MTSPGETLLLGAMADTASDVHFFNGRLLTAADLSAEQAARDEADRTLARAIGAGVVEGLDVRLAPAGADGPALAITPGLGVTPAGHLLRLEAPRRLLLARPPAPPEAVATPHGFSACQPAGTGIYVAGAGLYLLVATPAARTAGRAPVTSLTGEAGPCNADRRVHGLALALLEVPFHLLPGLTLADPDARNRIAYRCFGAGVLASHATNLMARGDRADDLLAALRPHGLTPAMLPLALLAVTGSLTPAFLDMWAVRRPATLADGGANPLASLAAPRRISTGRAMLLQFEAERADRLGRLAVPGAIRARTHFRHLPPVGALPFLTADGVRQFLDGMTVRGPVHLTAAQVEPLVRASLAAPAIDTESDELVWLYAVAENRLAASAPEPPERYHLFASGHLAYAANARFNLHRFDAANVAIP
jgi:hypothetical protein